MALQRSLDVVANNIANSSTTGFKREAINFDTYVMHPEPTQSLHFVFDRSTYRDAAPGTLQTTGNPLDLAIQGPGYFEVQTAAGTRYTRDGAFQVDSQGQLVTLAGQPVLSDGGQPIIVPDSASNITVSGDGFISAQTGTESSRTELGKLGIVSFANEQQVIPEGGNLFSTAQTPTPITDNVLVQGAIEQSNVRPITEMTSMLQIMRSYEQASNMISQENSRLSDAITKLSQTTS